MYSQRLSSGTLYRRLVVASLLWTGAPAWTWGQVRQLPVMPGLRANWQTGTSEAATFVTLAPPPRELQRSLNRAERWLKDGQYAEALEALDGILQDAGVGDFFLPSSATRESLKSKVYRLLGDMPEPAREVYQLQFGDEARRMLDRAIATHSTAELQEVCRRYFHTTAGYEAAYLLARKYLDEAEPLAAAMTLRRLLKSPAARNSLGSDASIVLAIAWDAAGQREEAIRVLTELQQTTPPPRFWMSGRETSLPHTESDLGPWLATIVGSQPLAHPRNTAWTTIQGDSRRDRRVDGGMPLPRLEWEVPITLWESESSGITDLHRRFLEQEAPTIPSLQPLVGGDFVFMRTPDVSLGVRLDNGIRQWVPYPANRLRDEQSMSPIAERNPAQATAIQLGLQQRVWEDGIHAQVSRDDRCFYLVSGLNVVNAENNEHAMLWGRFGDEEPMAFVHNNLVAVEFATEGKTVWMLGGEEGEDPQLADTFFLGPPLSVAGQLLAIVEQKDEIRLLALDPATGHGAWSQQLAQVEPPFSVALNQFRRFGGAVPSFASGVLICPTSSGLVVAVDVATRTLMWSYAYPHAKSNGARNWETAQFYGSLAMPRWGDRWLDATALIADDCVLLTPIESDQLHCLNLVSGQPQWKPVPRGDGLFLGGVHEGVIAVVERRRVRSHRIADGKEAWPPLELPGGALPSGRGFVCDQYLYLPTTAAQLLKIDLVSGEIAETLATGHVLGNLTCAGDYLISQAPDAMRAFLLRDHLREQLLQDLKDHPEDPQTLEAYANLLLGDGKLTEAVEALQRSLRYQTNERDRTATTRLLVQTTLTALSKDFASHQDLLPVAREHATLPDEQLALLRIESDGFVKVQDHVSAMASLLKLAKALGSQPAGLGQSVTGQPHPDDENVRLSEPAWIARQVAHIAAKAPPSQLPELERIIADYLQQVREKGDVTSLKHALTILADDPAADDLHHLLFEQYRDDHQELAAELLMAKMIQGPPTPDRVRGLLALGDLNSERRRPQDALRFYLDAQASLKDLTVNLDSVAADSQDQAATIAQKIDACRGLLASPDWSWQPGVPTVDDPGERRDDLKLRGIVPVEIEDGQGPVAEGWFIVYDAEAQEILAFDPYGQTRCRVPLGLPDRLLQMIGMAPVTGKFMGDLLVLGIGSRLVAINLLANGEFSGSRILWQRDLYDWNNPAAAALQMTEGISFQQVNNPFLGGVRNRIVSRTGLLLARLGPLNPDSLCFISHLGLECVDPLTGEMLWRRRDVDAGCRLYGDDQYVYVQPEGETTAQVFALHDGSEVGANKVPLDSQHWACRGRYVLAFKQQLSWLGRQRNLELFLWDPSTAKRVWKRNFDAGSMGCLVEWDEVAVINPQGKLEVLRIHDGTTVLEASVPLEHAPVISLEVKRSSRQYLAIANYDNMDSYAELQRHGIQINGPGRGSPFRRLTGQMLAFDRTTGKPLWQRPVPVHQYFLPTHQPAELPFMPLYRSIQIPETVQAEKQPHSRRRMRLLKNQLAILDVRTGTLAAISEKSLPIWGAMMMRGDPQSDHLEIVAENGPMVRYALTDQPPTSTEPAVLEAVAPPATPPPVQPTQEEK